MSANVPSTEEFERPAKALVDSGTASTFADAKEMLGRGRPQIVAGADATQLLHQAALLTAVETTARAFGHAVVHLSPGVAATSCSVAGHHDETIADAVRRAGGHMVDISDLAAETVPTIVIGTTSWAGRITLQVTWDQWFAHIDVRGRRLPERGNMILAAVAAAALAVTECFKRVLGSLEACHQNRSLNLWRPQADRDSGSVTLPDDVIGPNLRYLPSSWWLVGLGHLGQAYAWCLQFLPYMDPGTCQIVLQDFDKVSPANRSTGMFVRASDEGQLKTRVIAAAMERAGFDTRMIERRLLAETRRHETEPSLALIGVDKVGPRRLISDVGWTFAVDVGLGAGPVDFTGISVHTFPAVTPSKDVPAWQEHESSRRAERAQEQRAYRDARASGADPCGLVQLAETAVAAPFVGVVAACIAVAEPLRVLHGQTANSHLAFDAGRASSPKAHGGHKRPRIGFVPVELIADL